jgi:deazaflavin-dependent oxidoreductase (nitroreductase family)
MAGMTSDARGEGAAPGQADHPLDPAAVRRLAIEEEPRHRKLLRSAADGRRLSAMMLHAFLLRPPAGFGVITTTGAKTGRRRRKCVRAIRTGDVVYLVALRPPAVAIAKPSFVNAWVWNIRANPDVTLRIRGGTYAGVARELSDPPERARARAAFCDTVSRFDTGECLIHLRGRPTRAKVVALHDYWFDTGITIAVDLEPAQPRTA